MSYFGSHPCVYSWWIQFHFPGGCQGDFFKTTTTSSLFPAEVLDPSDCFLWSGFNLHAKPHLLPPPPRSPCCSADLSAVHERALFSHSSTPFSAWLPLSGRPASCPTFWRLLFIYKLLVHILMKVNIWDWEADTDLCDVSPGPVQTWAFSFSQISIIHLFQVYFFNQYLLSSHQMPRNLIKTATVKWFGNMSR